MSNIKVNIGQVRDATAGPNEMSSGSEIETRVRGGRVREAAMTTQRISKIAHIATCLVLVTALAGCWEAVPTVPRDVVIDIPHVNVRFSNDGGGNGEEVYLFGMQWQSQFGKRDSTHVTVLEPSSDTPNEVDDVYSPPVLGNNSRAGDFLHVPEYIGRAHFDSVPPPITSLPEAGPVPLAMYGMIMCAMEADTAGQRLDHLEGFRRLADHLGIALEDHVEAINLEVGSEDAYSAVENVIDSIVRSEAVEIGEVVNDLNKIQDALLKDFWTTATNELGNLANSGGKKDVGGAIQAGAKLIWSFAKYLSKREGVDDLYGCVHLTRVNATETVWSALKSEKTKANEIEEADKADGVRATCWNRRHPVCPFAEDFGGGTGSATVSFGETTQTSNLETRPVEDYMFSTSRSQYQPAVKRYNVRGSQNVSAIPAGPLGSNDLVFATIPEYRPLVYHDHMVEIDPSSTDYDLSATGNEWNVASTVELTTARLPSYVQVRRSQVTCSGSSCPYSFTVPAGYDGVMIPEVLQLDQQHTGKAFSIQLSQSSGSGGRDIHTMTVSPGYGVMRGTSLRVRYTVLYWPEDKNVEVQQQRLRLNPEDGTEFVNIGMHDLLLTAPVYGTVRAGLGWTGYTSHRLGPEYGPGTLQGFIAQGGGSYELLVTTVAWD